MPKTESKITVKAEYHLQIRRPIYNPAKCIK